ncbi:MAG TPA: TetR family transcriptional regulator C-terminal domain-containing protein, partial [Rhizomicrobium sp.]
LIAGMAERDRREFGERFAEVSSAPDFLAALSRLGEHYLEEEPEHKKLMCLEIGLESVRNPRIGEIYRSVDRYVEESFEKLFAALAADGRIAPDYDIPTVAKLFSMIGDGLLMRRALDPNFDSKTLVPAAIALVGRLLNVQPDAPASTHTNTAEKHR